MHFIVANSLSLSTQFPRPVSGPNFPPMVSKRQTNKRGGKNNACKSGRAWEEKKGRGKKEDMEVLQIKYGTEGKMEQEELRAGRRWAVARRTIASSGAGILYARYICAACLWALFALYLQIRAAMRVRRMLMRANGERERRKERLTSTGLYMLVKVHVRVIITRIW